MSETHCKRGHEFSPENTIAEAIDAAVAEEREANYDIAFKHAPDMIALEIAEDIQARGNSDG